MTELENIGWLEIIIGGILGTLIGFFAQHVLDIIFGIKYLRPLIGKYSATYKNGKKVENIVEIEVVKVKGRVMFIKLMNSKENLPIKCEIYFHTPKNGKGWYRHTESDAFGLSEMVIMDNKKLAIWNKYTKDLAYKKHDLQEHQGDLRMFSSIEQSYIWLKK